jgi:hypothetical protein
LTPEQQAKQKTCRQAKEKMKSAGLKVGMLSRGWHHPTQGPSEEQQQLARDGFIIAEKEYNQALADFKGSLGDLLSKK